MAYLTGMFYETSAAKTVHLSYALAALYAAPVIIQHLVPKDMLARVTASAEPYMYGLMIALMYAEAGPESAFIYFQF
jgi:alginate O-acetyltransferase complex protein AlgI